VGEDPLLRVWAEQRERQTRSACGVLNNLTSVIENTRSEAATALIFQTSEVLSINFNLEEDEVRVSSLPLRWPHLKASSSCAVAELGYCCSIYDLFPRSKRSVIVLRQAPLRVRLPVWALKLPLAGPYSLFICAGTVCVRQPAEDHQHEVDAGHRGPLLPRGRRRGLLPAVHGSRQVHRAQVLLASALCTAEPRFLYAMGLSRLRCLAAASCISATDQCSAFIPQQLPEAPLTSYSDTAIPTSTVGRPRSARRCGR